MTVKYSASINAPKLCIDGTQQSVCLSIRNACKTFRTRGALTSSRAGLVNFSVDALDDVSFDVPEGLITGIVGASGSGKSVLARAILGIETLDRGEIVHYHDPIHDEMRQGSPQRIQMVFQDPYSSLNPALRVHTHLSEVIKAGKGRVDSSFTERVTELLTLVGLSEETA